jgi:hypothetical protein
MAALPANGSEGPSQPARPSVDLLAFLAVLVVGVILILATGDGAAILTAYAGATSGLYAAWRRR